MNEKNKVLTVTIENFPTLDVIKVFGPFKYDFILGAESEDQ